MEIMVGVQYAKIERWPGTPLSKPSFSLLSKQTYSQGILKLCSRTLKSFLYTYSFTENSLARKITCFFLSFHLLGFTILFVQKSNILGYNDLH